MSEVYVPGDRLAEALERLDGHSSVEEIVQAIDGVVERVLVERRLEAEASMAEALSGLSGRIEGLHADLENDRRAKVQPEVDRLLRLRVVGASLSNRGEE